MSSANNCIKKTCSGAPITAEFNTASACYDYLKTCTVARKGGGCTTIDACSTYTSEF